MGKLEELPVIESALECVPIVACQVHVGSTARGRGSRSSQVDAGRYTDRLRKRKRFYGQHGEADIVKADANVLTE